MKMRNMNKQYEVCVVGGAGHVGAPLSIVLASRGLHTLVNDINEKTLEILRSGHLPFIEEGAEPLLCQAINSNMIGFSSHPETISNVPVIILTIGTPIDEFHNPLISVLTGCVDSLLPYISDEQTIILRSTVAPGVTEYLDRYLKSRGKKTALAFCPERVVQGKGVEEIQTLPQLVSGTSERAVRVATEIFERIAPEIIEMKPQEAEFAKLICNTYRYIQFAATNQLYMLVESAGCDYNVLLHKLKEGYPRMQSMPGPGFAAGPCLMKDTMQLFSYGKHNFPLGQVAMTINEGMPNYIVDHLSARFDLSQISVGILGMAFKAESDDIRDSLSYKLGKLLRFYGVKVFYTDEYVSDPTFVSKEELVANADVVVVGAPHRAYKGMVIPDHVYVVDLWDMFKLDE